MENKANKGQNQSNHKKLPTLRLYNYVLALRTSHTEIL
jgi:hypothetical protein